jgi:hypothetical protein
MRISGDKITLIAVILVIVIAAGAEIVHQRHHAAANPTLTAKAPVELPKFDVLCHNGGQVTYNQPAYDYTRGTGYIAVQPVPDGTRDTWTYITDGCVVSPYNPNKR